MLGKLKEMAKFLLGRSLNLKVQTQRSGVRLGTDYGGWTVCPDGLSANSVAYCIGVGDDVSFDLALIQRFGLQVHAFDPTPKAVAWVKKQAFPPQFHFHEYAVMNYDGEAKFFPVEEAGNVSHTINARPALAAHAVTAPARRLSTLMTELGHKRFDLLKMDIEGAEYCVIDDLLQARLDIGQIMVEFHHRFPEVGPARTRKAVRQLNEAGYRIFAMTPHGREVSFIKE